MPSGMKHCILRKNNDVIYYTQPKSMVNNIIFGKVYLDFYGVILIFKESRFQNHTTKDTGILDLKLRNWGGRNAYELDGHIIDSNGTKRFIL
jgi:hypothetical protein